MDLDPTGGGDLGHAIRFILPNARMANDGSLGGISGRLYVRPASHAGGPSGPTGSVPYGARLRLHDDFDVAAYSPPARVILNTLMRFGIVLADGGTIALTAESDLFTTTNVGGSSGSARESSTRPPERTVTIDDFDVIDTGPRIAETYDCVRTTVDPWLFADGFETGDSGEWSAVLP